jgi:hypothetical protein
MKAFVRYTTNGDLQIRTPYLAAFVDALKSSIPWDEREWDSATKIWTVGAQFAAQAIAIVRRFYDDVEISRPTDGRSSSSSSTNAGDWYRALHLLPTAPPPVIDAAYKALARLHHPDLGGDTTAMQRINAAYDRLKERA